MGPPRPPQPPPPRALSQSAGAGRTGRNNPFDDDSEEGQQQQQQHQQQKRREEERPWIRDHRRTPRSVRPTKSSTNPFDCSPASTTTTTSRTPTPTKQQQQQQQQQIPPPPNLPTFSPLPSYAYPTTNSTRTHPPPPPQSQSKPPQHQNSRNNMAGQKHYYQNGNKNRNGGAGVGGLGVGVGHQKRDTINNNINRRNRNRNNNSSTNPFDSSTASSSSASRSMSSGSSSSSGIVQRERRTPPHYRNPFDTPSPRPTVGTHTVTSSRVLPSPTTPTTSPNSNINGKGNGNNPFDGDSSTNESSSPSNGNSNSSSNNGPTVRVTVHEDRNRRFDSGGMRVYPVGRGGGSNGGNGVNGGNSRGAGAGAGSTTYVNAGAGNGTGVTGPPTTSVVTTRRQQQRQPQTSSSSTYDHLSVVSSMTATKSAVDSLELILDASRTQGSGGTTTGSDNNSVDEPEEGSNVNHRQGPAVQPPSYAHSIDHQGQVRRVVALATTAPSRSPRAMYTPSPPPTHRREGPKAGNGVSTSTSPFSQIAHSPLLQNQYHRPANSHNRSPYGSHTTTSPRAQEAAESLLQSFDQNRRQQQQQPPNNAARTDNHHDNNSSETETASGTSNSLSETTGSDQLEFDYSKTDDTDNSTPSSAARAAAAAATMNNNPLGSLESIDELEEQENIELELFHDEDVDDDDDDVAGDDVGGNSNAVAAYDANDISQYNMDDGQKTGPRREGDEPIISPSKSTDACNYTLHDLCDEAPTTDDIAWRNALVLLSINPDLAELKEPECLMTPLHVACLAHEPPPIWMTRGLLYTSPSSCLEEDKGGRLPLHLLAATSADVDTMRLLAEEFPPGVAHKDHRGFTPLHLLLKNDHVELTLEHVRLLLGQVTYGTTKTYDRQQNQRFLFRRGDHLTSNVDDINSMSQERENEHEQHFRQYPDDVRRALTKITHWKRREVNKNNAANLDSQSPILHKEEHFLRCKNSPFTDPSSVATPTGHLLPLHMLLRRNNFSHQAHNDVLLTRKAASLVDLIRILVVAYPSGLVEQDLSGKTPIMTAMLHADFTPDVEIIELLLGLRTTGADKFSTVCPASIAVDETQQLPLHVAAEEMLAYPSILTAICEAYPEARTVQDSRGRTPLHLALQNFRSFPVDADMLSLLFVDSVAKIRDNEGETPFDLVLKNPRSLREPDYSSESASVRSKELIFQQFLDSSVDKPRSRSDARFLIQNCRMMPPWLRRQACAARFVQDALIEDMTSPFSTFRILMSGFVLAVLLAMIRRLLHVNDDLAVVVYYLATYHLTMQVMCWSAALALGEFFRLVIANPWRWIDLATGILAIVTANISSTQAGNSETISYVGASATAFCWLSIVGYLVDWWIGAAIFVGSATRLFIMLIWPICVAVMGIVAASQVFYTLEDCVGGGICNLSDAYTFVYWMILGQPVVIEDFNYSSATLTTIVVFTLLIFWWIVSVLGATISQTAELSRHQIALALYWEPKVSITISAFGSVEDPKNQYRPNIIDRYCASMSNMWTILVAAFAGKGFETDQWYSCCFRSRLMAAMSQFLAMVALPVWLALGAITFGLLWPPQVRRWLFTIGGRPTYRKDSDTTFEGGISKAKLSQLQLDINELKAATYGQGSDVQRDLALIKDVLFRALADDVSVAHD